MDEQHTARVTVEVPYTTGPVLPEPFDPAAYLGAAAQRGPLNIGEVKPLTAKIGSVEVVTIPLAHYADLLNFVEAFKGCEVKMLDPDQQGLGEGVTDEPRGAVEAAVDFVPSPEEARVEVPGDPNPHDELEARVRDRLAGYRSQSIPTAGEVSEDHGAALAHPKRRRESKTRPSQSRSIPSDPAR